MKYTGDSRGHELAEVKDDGITVLLEDGSRWQVYEGFAERSCSWQAGDIMTVKPGKDPEFPYLLVNVSANNSVECRLLADRCSG